MTSASSPVRRVLLAAILGAIACGVFAGALGHQFVNFDDNVYVTDNPWVQRGLTGESLRWAFTTGHATNWHPVTWISHMIDVELFGLDPRGHHATAVFLHAVNSMLLWYVLWLMTGAVWRSWAVALGFAVHPLHVESVAWVAERKDVLSTLFFLLTLWAYVRMVRHGSWKNRAAALGIYAVGLMTKPMLITLPALLLVLDYWPLGRWRGERAGAEVSGKQGKPLLAPVPFRRLVLEKVPFLILAVVSSAITYAVQSKGGAVTAADALPLSIRASNACLSYVRYLGKTVWPVDLAIFYPHPGLDFKVWVGGVAAVGLVGMTVLAFRQAGKRPYLVTGWLWYLGTLVPVVGLVQVGGQSMADRYTYIPLIGVFVAVVWGVGELVSKRPGLRTGVIIAGGILAIVLCGLTVRQVGTWKDSITLFTHARNVTGPNWMAEYNLGIAYGQLGNHAEAIPHYEAATRLKAGADAYNNLAVSLAAMDRMDEALEALTHARVLNPGDASIHLNLGNLAATRGRMDEARSHWREALRLDPTNVEARENLESTAGPP